MGMPPKRPRSPAPSVGRTGAPGAPSAPSHARKIKSPPDSDAPAKPKKLKLQAALAAATPFPAHARPTPAEAHAVFDLLARAHRRPRDALVRRPPAEGGNAAQTCGAVPNVLEALIGTILSQNTSGKNSTRAKHMLDAAFGRNNFAAMAEAPRAAVVDAIRSGGLANKKAGMIQNLLNAVKARHGEYSLQYLAAPDPETGLLMPDEDIMQELMSYDGVGPKTASCVLLFCLGRDSFAVDTHVFRLSKLLGWVPPTADRVLTQAHLDIRVPAELKYGLHVLMIQHGRACKGCKRPGASEQCVLKEFLKDYKGQDGDKIDETVEMVKMEEEDVKAEQEDISLVVKEEGNEVKPESHM